MSDTQVKATPRPWRYEPDGSTGMNDCCIWGSQGPGHGAVGSVLSCLSRLPVVNKGSVRGRAGKLGQYRAVCEIASTGLLYTATQWQEFKANADLIVRAVNSHDRLLEALKAAWEPWEKLLREGKIGIGGYPASLEKARAAIQSAEGEARDDT